MQKPFIAVNPGLVQCLKPATLCSWAKKNTQLNAVHWNIHRPNHIQNRKTFLNITYDNGLKTAASEVCMHHKNGGWVSVCLKRGPRKKQTPKKFEYRYKCIKKSRLQFLTLDYQYLTVLSRGSLRPNQKKLADVSCRFFGIKIQETTEIFPPTNYACQLWFSSSGKHNRVNYCRESINFLRHYKSHLLSFLVNFSPTDDVSTVSGDLPHLTQDVSVHWFISYIRLIRHLLYTLSMVDLVAFLIRRPL